MRVIINRNLCGHHAASCEVCFGELLRKGGRPDGNCTLDAIDDGKEEVTAVITSGGYTTELVVTAENREEIIYDGFMKFVDLPFEAFEVPPPTGDDIRRITREYQQQTKDAKS
ncbi:MAG: hypothetical protein IT331_18340 [Anaerolineae bacterium]|nr:hypothetical protein [Anaerolineae bacterium]